MQNGDLSCTRIAPSLLRGLLTSTSLANAELQAKTSYADCEGKMENVGVHAGPQSSTRLLQTLNCGEQVAVIGRADANDWFKVKTQQGVEGYVWMFLADHQSAVSVRRLAIALYWIWRKGWDYEQSRKFGSHAGKLGTGDGVQ